MIQLTEVRAQIGQAGDGQDRRGWESLTLVSSWHPPFSYPDMSVEELPASKLGTKEQCVLRLVSSLPPKSRRLRAEGRPTARLPSFIVQLGRSLRVGRRDDFFGLKLGDWPR